MDRSGDHDGGSESERNLSDGITLNELRTVYEKLFGVRARWYELGLALGLSSDTLDAVGVNNRDARACLREMLTQRLQSRALTWRVLCDSLRSPIVGRIDVADEIERDTSFISNVTHTGSSGILAEKKLTDTYGITSDQLDCEIKEGDMIILARHFDNVEYYLNVLGLTPAEQSDVRKKALDDGARLAINHALLLWRRHNPSIATLRTLLQILQDLKKEKIASDIARYFKLRENEDANKELHKTKHNQKYLQKLDELMKDTENTILLYYLKMFFIGSSGMGKSTTKQRLTGAITNLSSLPEELRKRCSTLLAKFNQVLAMVDVDKSKLTLMKVSDSLEKEMQDLFEYVYSNVPDSTPANTDASGRPLVDLPTDDPKPVTSTNTYASDSDSKPVLTEATPQPVSSVRDSEQMTVTTVNVDEVIDRFRSIVGSGNYAKQLMNKILLNLVDVGGQPGFLEMLPFLSKGPGMFLAFFRLDKELDEFCEVSYERDDDKITPYSAIYTIRETLSQILSAISHHVKLDTALDRELLSKLGDFASVKPVATLVGTFKDKLETKVKTETLHEKLSSAFPQASASEKEEVVKQVLASQLSGERPTTCVNTDMLSEVEQFLASDDFQKSVKDQLDQELEKRNEAVSTVTCNFEDLLFHPTDSKHFIALDNFTGEEADIDSLCEHLQIMFDNFFKDAQLRIRPSQLLLGVILRKEYDIVSMDDSIQIGKALNMTEEEVRFSVWYLDRFVGALIYHPEIGDKDDWFETNIICSPQVVFDSISSLIVEPLLELHSSSKGRGFTAAEKRNWTEKGQFSMRTVKRCLSKNKKMKLKQGKLIPIEKLVVFLESSNLLSQIPKEKQGQKEFKEEMFFIPAILDCASPIELTKTPSPNVDTPSPIKITFENRYVPIGLFCALISRLVTIGNKILGLKWELVQSGVKKNLATFLVDSAKHRITLVAHVDCYEVRVIRQDRSISLHDLCSYVLSAVLYVMKEINENIKPIVAFDCHCGSSKSNHLCELSLGATTSFRCSKDHSTVLLKPDEECWFAKEVAVGDDVTLDVIPFTDPDSILSFKWSKCGKEVGCNNELRVEKVTQAHCKGFYTCEISKDEIYHCSMYYTLKTTGGKKRPHPISCEGPEAKRPSISGKSKPKKLNVGKRSKSSQLSGSVKAQDSTNKQDARAKYATVSSKFTPSKPASGRARKRPHPTSCEGPEAKRPSVSGVPEEKKRLTIDTLKNRCGVTDAQLETMITEEDLQKLALCFDSVEAYLDKLGLSPGQQTDVRDIAFRKGTHTAMKEALKLWLQPNPFYTTYKSLIEIFLDLNRGDIAIKICNYITDNIPKPK